MKDFEVFLIFNVWTGLLYQFHKASIGFQNLQISLTTYANLYNHTLLYCNLFSAYGAVLIRVKGKDKLF